MNTKDFTEKLTELFHKLQSSVRQTYHQLRERFAQSSHQEPEEDQSSTASIFDHWGKKALVISVWVFFFVGHGVVRPSKK